MEAPKTLVAAYKQKSIRVTGFGRPTLLVEFYVHNKKKYATSIPVSLFETIHRKIVEDKNVHNNSKRKL